MVLVEAELERSVSYRALLPKGLLYAFLTSSDCRRGRCLSDSESSPIDRPWFPATSFAISRRQLRGDVGVEDHDESNYRRQRNAVTDREPEQTGFIGALHSGCRRGHGDTGEADHFAHHTTRRV